MGVRSKVEENRREEEGVGEKTMQPGNHENLVYNHFGGFLLPCVPTLIHTYFVCGNTYLLCVRKKYLMTMTTESAHDLVYSEWIIMVSQLPYKDIRNGCLEECYKCR